MNKMEVLAPAGNLLIFKSVIDAGADAVYFGGKLFSARAYANNFDYEESKAALDYAHLHGKKAYLTLNTLVKNIEFNKELFDYVNFYYENGLDGIIVQDIGVIRYIRDNFPDLNVHGSTQMAVCNTDGVRLLYDMGITRVVPARELSLDEIKTIHDNTDIELEVFVHGALCYCYSGDCLFSSLAGGRSGNRGRCAQPCRLEYNVYEGDKAVNTKGSYVLSLKDLCGIKDLDKLYRSGVSSLKIEGRMKQKQYATNVVNVYRRYVDRLMNNIAAGREEYYVDKQDKKLLFDLGNRCGFTNSYYYNNTDDMVTFTKPNHQSKDIEYEYSEDKLLVDCKFTAHIGKPSVISLTYNDITINISGAICEAASKKPVTTNDIDKRLKKTGATSFELCNIEYDIDDNIFLPLGEIGKLRREALDKLQERILATYNRQRIEHRDTPFPKEQRKSDKSISNLIISISTKEQLDTINNITKNSDITKEFDLVIPMSNYELFEKVAKNTDKYICTNLLVELPYIIRESTRKVMKESIELLNMYHGYIVHSYDGLSFIRKHELNGTIISGSHMYTFNNCAIDAVSWLGINYSIAPLELNHKELSHRHNNNSILTIYGRSPMMITANCVNKNCGTCDKNEKILTLKDKKGHIFPVRNLCMMCYNVIYNDLPTCLFNELDTIDELGFNAVKIDFTVEADKTTESILKQYINASYNGPHDNDGRYTKGHWNRGVE